jgi:hypothetical protein
MHVTPKNLGFIKLTAGANITASADLSGVNDVLVMAECVATAASQTSTLYLYCMDTNTNGTASTYLTTVWGTTQMAAQGDVGTTALHYWASVNVAGKGRYLLAHVVNGSAGSSASLHVLGFRREDGAEDVTTLNVTKYARA